MRFAHRQVRCYVHCPRGICVLAHRIPCLVSLCNTRNQPVCNRSAPHWASYVNTISKSFEFTGSPAVAPTSATTQSRSGRTDASISIAATGANNLAVG
jgi:hypothetical protein